MEWICILLFFILVFFLFLKNVELKAKHIKKMEDLNEDLIQKNMMDAAKESKKLQEQLQKMREKLLQQKEMDWQTRKELQRILDQQKELEKLVEEAKKAMEENKKNQEEFSERSEEMKEKQEKLEDLMEEVVNDEMKSLMEKIQELMQELNKDEALKMMEEMEMNDNKVNKQMDRMLELFKQLEIEKEVTETAKELEKLSFKDGLTGVANRRMFDSVMDVEWLNAKRHRHPLSLIMVDIDYFKQYNDHYGHLQGDACLKQVAQVLSQSVTRARDLIARFGGEEFVLLVPSTPIAGGQQLLQTLLDGVEQCPFHFRGERVTITLSAGLAVFTGEEGSDKVFERADQALYRAKSGGRNRVELG